MKRFLALLSVLVLSISMLVGCGSKTADNDELVVYFVPSRDPAEIQKATKPLAEMLNRSLVIAGPSEKGQKLAAKINNGEKLTLDDIQGATWGVSSNTTSPAGYIYPSLWLQENFGISITDLKSKVALDNYATSLSQLASGQIDVMVTYADARLDYVDQWNSNFGRTASIWDETNVIGVTDGIYNDTISVTKDASMTSELKEAIQQAFINIGNTEEGQKIISIYSHKGYEIGNSSDYDAEREAQKLIKSMQ